MVERKIWEKLFQTIEEENYEEYEKVLQFLQTAGTDELPASELIRQTLSILCDKLSYVLQDHQGRLCEIRYVINQIPEMKLNVKKELLSAIEGLKREDLADILEDENLMKALIRKTGLEDKYSNFLAMMDSYPKRFSVFSLLSVYVRIGLNVQTGISGKSFPHPSQSESDISSPPQNP